MARSDVRTRVAGNINRDDIPDSSGGKIDQWINDAQREICRVHDFGFMETEATVPTVDGQQSYELPDGSGTELRFKTEINCELINASNGRVDLIKIHKQDAEKRVEYEDSTESGTPRHYAVQYKQLHFYPAPAHASNSNTAWTVNFEYYGYLDDLSADADTNDLIANYPEVVEAAATAAGFRYVGEFDRATYWRAIFKEGLAEMISEDNIVKYGTLEEGMAPRAGAGTYPRKRRRDLTAHYE
jgi:hypothetical protein